MEPLFVIILIVLLAIGGRVTLFLIKSQQKEKAKEEYKEKVVEAIAEYDQ